VNKYTDAHACAISLEEFRERWQYQIATRRDKLGRPYPGNTLRVGLAICWHINRDSREAFPGINTIAKKVGISRSTVLRTIKDLEDGGDLRIRRDAKRRGGTRANRYIPFLKANAVQMQNTSELTPPSVIAMTPPSTKAVTPRGVKAVAPEPLREPLTEPLREPLSYKASVSTDADSRKTQGKRLGEVSKIAVLSAKPNLTAQCFGLAEKWWPKDRALVAKALKNYPAAEVLAELQIAVEDGLEIREVLAGMVADYDAA
jgi:DNA-binding Lrp family transcriptional regulator